MSSDHFQTENTTIDDIEKPMWENRAESPIIEHIPSSKYKLKLKYGGFFRLAKNTCRNIYCFGSQKCIYIDTWSYNLSQLNDEVVKRYATKDNPEISIRYVDKCASNQSFVELDSNEKFMAMLRMYENEKEITIYATTVNNLGSANLDLSNLDSNNLDFNNHDEVDSDYCPSDESYHSHLSSNDEDDSMNDDNEGYASGKNSVSMIVGTKFENVVDFRNALNHYAITNEFNYVIQKSEPTRFRARCENMDCEWRIYASIMQDGITFEVRKIVEGHTCIRSNKGGNKRATQGWVADIVSDKLKSDGDVSPVKLRKWIMKTYNVNVPYLKVVENKAEIKCKGKRWEVCLNERKCSCRVWQVTGLPCVHAAAFIAFTRTVNWEKYVDSCYTIETFKKAYALEVAPMPGQDQWMQKTGDKIYPPITRRPPGRPKKNRIKASNESKRRHKCPRCGEYGHREKTCKSHAPQGSDPSETSTSKRRNKCT